MITINIHGCPNTTNIDLQVELKTPRVNHALTTTASWENDKSAALALHA